MAYADAMDRLKEIGIVAIFGIGAIWIFFYATTTRRVRQLARRSQAFCPGR